MATDGLKEILECNICLDVIKDPFTLAVCLHSYCRDCIDRVPRKLKEGKQGWTCPQCNQFSPDDHDTPTFFIKKVLAYHHQKGQQVCGQCQQKDNIENECLDCKMCVCNNCLLGHLRIPNGKGHRIVAVNNQEENLIDVLVFCSVHPDEVIKFNCKKCEVPMCMKCKVMQHEGHETEEVDDALERLQKTLNENTNKVKFYMESVDAQIKTLEKEIELTRQEFNKSRKALATASQKLIESIKLITDDFEKKMNDDEAEKVREIEAIKLEREMKYKELSHLTDLVAATTEKSRNVCLLKSLQEGLYKQVQRNAESNIDTIGLEKKRCKFEESLQSQNEVLEQLKVMIGKYVTYSTNVFVNPQGEMHFSGKFKDTIIKPMKKVNEIVFPVFSYRMSYIEQHLWVCIPGANLINIYNTDGILTRSIKGCPFNAIQKAFTNQLVTACNDGLYVSNDMGNTFDKVTDGLFTDITVHDQYFAALNYITNSVVCYQYDITCKQWREHLKFNVDQIKDNNPFDSLVYTGHSFFICSYNDDTVYKYSKEGVFIQHSDKYSGPLLCGVDSQGHLLITSWDNSTLNLINTDDMSNIDTQVKLEVPNGPWDVVIDVNQHIWFLSYGPSKLTKYTT